MNPILPIEMILKFRTELIIKENMNYHLKIKQNSYWSKIHSNIFYDIPFTIIDH